MKTIINKARKLSKKREREIQTSFLSDKKKREKESDLEFAKSKISSYLRERALEILWRTEAVYDEKKSIYFVDIEGEVTKQEWAMIAPFYDKNNYRADRVLRELSK